MEFIDMKKCSQCGETKHINEFRNFARSKDGKKPNCKNCQKEKDARYRNENSEKVKEAREKWAKENKAKMDTCRDNWEEANKERKKILAKIWRDKNREQLRKKSINSYYMNREKYLENGKKWREKNRDAHCATEAKRRAAKILATPKWADSEMIASIYAFSSFMNMVTFSNGYHVDHIVPLKGKSVCGLHCEDNLRVISAIENMRKHNKLIEDLL